MPTLSFDDQFGCNLKSKNQTNNIIATIKRLILNISEYKLSFKKMIKKALYKTCKFFMHSIRYISSKDKIAFHKIKLGLKPF